MLATWHAKEKRSLLGWNLCTFSSRIEEETDASKMIFGAASYTRNFLSTFLPLTMTWLVLTVEQDTTHTLLVSEMHNGPGIRLIGPVLCSPPKFPRYRTWTGFWTLSRVNCRKFLLDACSCSLDLSSTGNRTLSYFSLTLLASCCNSADWYILRNSSHSDCRC